jgi:SAM-dependent methyltransferase
MSHPVKYLEPGRPARAGQLILKRRFRILESILPAQHIRRRLLDIGCGNGAQTRLLKPFAGQLFGLDIVGIDTLEGAVAGDEFSFIRAGAMELPFQTETFDLVTAFEVLEHLPDDAAAVAEAARVLRPGGYFFFTVPNRWWIFETHGMVIPGLNWIPWNRVPFVGWMPQTLHRRVARARNYTLSQALSLAREAGLTTVAGGYVTAPLDVLPDSALRDLLRGTLFGLDITANPLLAVNMFILAEKE